MKDPPKVLLLDSNAYFRLARTIRPLLEPIFGDNPRYELMILDELNREYGQNPRLRTKFEWVNDTEFQHDRTRRCYRCTGKSTEAVAIAYSFIAAQARVAGVNVSLADLRALAVGYSRGFVVVTDDQGMEALASQHGIECWSVIKLLRLMQTENRISLAEVRQALEYWVEENDLPMGRDRLRREYRRLFRTDCPV